MIDNAGAALAAAEGVAPQADAALDPDNGNRARETAPERSQETARASVDRAFAALEERAPDAEQTGSSSADAQTAGKESADTATSQDFAQPPMRFSPEARAAWAGIPESVRNETHRALKEMGEGLARYQGYFEPLKPYQQLAEKFGTTVPETLGRYVALDFALLSKAPEERMKAIASVLEHAGITPSEYAAQIMGQKPDEAQTQSEETIRGLRQEVTDLRNQLGGVSKSLEQRQDDEISRQLGVFAADNPRLKETELQRMMVSLLNGNLAHDLKTAFDMAVRLTPEPAKDNQPAASNAATRKPAPAQTRNGNLSITGAPGSGSNPARRKAPQTARESVDNAFDSLGLG